MTVNSVKEKLLQGRAVVGAIMNIGCAPLVEMLGLTQLDYVLFDMEHGPISSETLANLIRASKCVDLVPMARVRENNAKMILQALDLGACGVMVPQIETREDAEAAVDATRYWPTGKRGLSSFTPAGGWGTIAIPQYIEQSNQDVILIAQIETSKGLDNVEPIAQVEGVDVLLVGPSDLSQALGHPGEFDHPVVRAAIGKAIKATAHSTTLAGALVRTAKEVEEYYKQGVRFFITGVLGLFYRAAAEHAVLLKGALSDSE